MFMRWLAMWSLVICGILIISNEVLLRYVCVYYCLTMFCYTINDVYTWYICSTWFLDIRLSTYILWRNLIENNTTQSCIRTLHSVR